MSEQGTQDWFADRCGKVTASRIEDVMAKLKSGGEAASRANYRAQLVAERLTGTVAESYSNDAMRWGTDNEPIARAEYETRFGVMIDQVGMVRHPMIEMSGASPDGLIDSNGLIEIKCPNTATHIDYLLTRAIPNKYQLQMLWQMACTGRTWCDFVSFDPRLPSHLSLLVIRFDFDAARAGLITDEVIRFLSEVDETVNALNNMPINATNLKE
jgi:putative phage-type endonuclease